MSRLTLTPTERARTVLASLPRLTWARGGEQLAVPFVEEVGSPQRRARGLRLSGEFWPVAQDASLAWLRDIWAEHAGCSPECSGRATHLSELVETATWLTGTPDVLATRIEWVDAAGLELTVIDRTGSRRVRHDFPSSVSRPEDLFGAVHRLVQHAGAGPRTA